MPYPAKVYSLALIFGAQSWILDGHCIPSAYDLRLITCHRLWIAHKSSGHGGQITVSCFFYAGKCFATLDSPDSWAASQRIEVHAVQEKNKRQKGSVDVVFWAWMQCVWTFGPFWVSNDVKVRFEDIWSVFDKHLIPRYKFQPLDLEMCLLLCKTLLILCLQNKIELAWQKRDSSLRVK